MRELRIGGLEDTEFVHTIMSSLMSLKGLNPMLFAELAYYADTPSANCFGGQSDELSKLGLLDEQGQMPDRIRNIVRSCLPVRGIEISMALPYKE